MTLHNKTIDVCGATVAQAVSQTAAGASVAPTSETMGSRASPMSLGIDGQWPGKGAGLGCDFSGAVSESASAISLQQVTLAVLWVSALAIGVVGGWRLYPPPKALEPGPPPIQAERLNVRLAAKSTPGPKALTSAAVALDQPPPVPQLLKLPPSPRLAAVASPSERLAFAIPVTAASREVSPRDAQAEIPAQAVQTVSDAKPASRAPIGLAFGVGEGDQPAPEYPFAAKRAHQTGVVVIRFSVGTDGRVLTAEVSEPSPWKLLNEEALRTVQRRWRFGPGAVRDYTVPIEFQLSK